MEMAHPDSQHLSLYSEGKACYGMVSDRQTRKEPEPHVSQNESVYNCSVAFLSRDDSARLARARSVSSQYIKINKFTAINQRKLSQCVFALVAFLFLVNIRDDAQFCRCCLNSNSGE